MDVSPVAHAQRVLLSPFDYPGLGEWAEAASRALLAATGLDHAAFFHAGHGAPPVFLTHSDDAQRAYAEYGAALDFATPRALACGLEVAHQYDVMGRGEFLRSALYQDYARPHGMEDAMLLRAAGPPSEDGWIAFQHGRQLSESEVESIRAMLQALHPAFRAGLAMARRLDGWRGELVRTVDALSEGVLVRDLDGRTLHENPALGRFLAADPEGSCLRSVLDEVGSETARAVREGRLVPGALHGRAVATGIAVYRVTGSVVGRDLFRPGETVLVTLWPLALPAVSDATLRERFGLTLHQTRIARLLADGLSNAQIAERLGISPYTARRHTEQVLHKLGVASRAGVAKVLLTGGDGRG